MKNKRMPSHSAFSERLYMNCRWPSLYFCQRYNKIHVWNSSVFFLGKEELGKQAQHCGNIVWKHSSDVLLAHRWKTGSALCHSFLEEALLACALYFTKCLWMCLDHPQSALRVYHHPWAICKFGSKLKLKASFLQFKPAISCAIILPWLLLLPRCTFTSRNPFLSLYKTAVKMFKIAWNEVFIPGQMFTLFKMWKESSFCLMQVKKAWV